MGSTYAISSQLSLQKGDLTGTLDDLRVDFNLLFAAASFHDRLWDVKLEFFFFLFGQAQSGAFLRLLCLLLDIGLFLVVNFSDEGHGLVDGHLRNDSLDDHLVLLRVKIDVFEGAIIDPFMHFVNEFKLVSLEIIACQDLNNVILVDEVNDPGDHSEVALNVERHTEGAQVMHPAQLVNQLIIGLFERTEVEGQGRAVLPALNLEKNFNDVADVILLVQGFALCVWERIQNLADSGQVFNEFFS